MSAQRWTNVVEHREPAPNKLNTSTASSWQEPGQAKRILVYAPEPNHVRDLHDGLSSLVDFEATADGAPCFRYRDVEVHLDVECDEAKAMDCLHSRYFNLVIVDARDINDGQTQVERHISQAVSFIDRIANEPDVEARYGTHRVMILVSGANEDRVDQAIARFGEKRVGRIIRDPLWSRLAGAAPHGEKRSEFFRIVANEAIRMMLDRKRGKRALCAAGGGITGLYFEMGALKCLDDCLHPSAINSFDMYFGISAGAIITGFLANGYSIDECMAAIAGNDSGRLPPISMSIFRLAHLNGPDIAARLLHLAQHLGASVADIFRGRMPRSLEILALEASDFLGAPLRGDAYEARLREFFSMHGATNDFRRLARPLYIGATDQDLRTRILFGDEGANHVPISQAIQASTAINPAFCASKIEGRYYEDGVVTSTCNFSDAIRKGADLIFVVDPFLPYVSKEPGYARKKGFLYNLDQDVRTMTYTRFENMRNILLTANPQVSSYTFVPSNSIRKLMSTNPMDHRPYLPIWRAAYLSTLRRIKLLQYRMRGDVATHGLRLDTSRADEVAARLERMETPSFAHFFPEGRISLRQPPLCREITASEGLNRPALPSVTAAVSAI